MIRKYKKHILCFLPFRNGNDIYYITKSLKVKKNLIIISIIINNVRRLLNRADKKQQEAGKTAAVRLSLPDRIAYVLISDICNAVK